MNKHTSSVIVRRTRRCAPHMPRQAGNRARHAPPTRPWHVRHQDKLRSVFAQPCFVAEPWTRLGSTIADHDLTRLLADGARAAAARAHAARSEQRQGKWAGWYDVSVAVWFSGNSAVQVVTLRLRLSPCCPIPQPLRLFRYGKSGWHAR